MSNNKLIFNNYEKQNENGESLRINDTKIRRGYSEGDNMKFINLVKKN